ncbi:MAG: PQQ-binding-like beta-propeller repeat protein [Treponema sp.]|nr:PQQ-binding-like beta-propeller repeat protein [Treponema sp.]
MKKLFSACFILNIFFLCLNVLGINALGVYAQNAAPDEAALSAEAPFWRQALGGSVLGRPAPQAESVVMISDGGSLKAYSWQGRVLWDFFAHGRLAPYLSRSPEGTSYVCRTNGILIAVNRSGRELWRINMGEALEAPVLIGWDGRLFAFTASMVRCYTASGFQLWSKPLNKKTGLAPVMDRRGGFYLVTEDAELICVDAFGGSTSHQLETLPSAIVSFNQTGGPFSMLLFFRGGNAELLNPVDGKREKFISLPQPVLAAAAFESNAALLQRDGTLLLLSIADRKILWTGSTHIGSSELSSGNPESQIIFDERGVYVLTKNGAAAFSIEGKRLWLIKISGGASFPAFSDEGVLYSGGTDWILYAYRPEERVKARKRVLYGPAPEGNYGTGLYQPESASGLSAYNEYDLSRTLAHIREVLKSGETGEQEQEFASRLRSIAGSGINLPRPSLGRNEAPVFFTYRCEAVQLLSYMGSRETVPFLADLFTRDQDLFVKAAAAEALGRIGVDPEGLALSAFTRAIFPPVREHDERILVSVASAAGALCRFSGPPLGEAAVRILVFLAGADKPSSARRKAETELRTLSSL